MRRARPLLGTIVEIRVAAEGAAADAAIAAAFAAVERVDALMSVHRAGSDLSRLNRHGHERAVRVDPWTYEVLAAAERIGRASAGLFDCAVGAVLARFGFLPGAAAMAGADPATQREMQLLSGCRVRFRRPLALDLGGIAKGFAIDKAVERLRAAGIRSGAVNAGGDLRVFGPEPEPVHLRDPDSPWRLVPVGWLSDGAIATSASYFAQRRHGEEWMSPIVDPRRGHPLAAGRRSVSVIAADALTADALTKPVMLAGDGCAALLAQYGAQAVILDPGAAPREVNRAA